MRNGNAPIKRLVHTKNRNYNDGHNDRLTVGVHSSMFILKTWSKLCSAHFKV